MKEKTSNLIQESDSLLSPIRKPTGTTFITYPVTPYCYERLESSPNSCTSGCTIASGYTYHKLRNIGKNSLLGLARKPLISKRDTEKIYAKIREALQRSEAFTT